jgi:hypothetical protein
LISSIDREDSRIHETLSDLVGKIADEVIKQMKENTNFLFYRIRKNYGHDLQTFSQGEAYLKIMKDKKG